MAAKIGVEELRARLHLRGLDSSGTKRILERRLDEALRKEGVESVMGKRERSSEEDFPAARVDDADAIRKMGIRELREQAALRGLSTAGAKVRLFERISAQLENDRRDLENADTSTGTEEKLVTATKKGGAVLDPYLPENVKASYHVFQRGNDIYDAILNQTNVRDNNNKFYVIQVLESDDGGKYMFYTRWGRVGVRGQDKLFGPFTRLEKATNEFEAKFFAKTNNEWSDRKGFVCHLKKYVWLEMDYDQADAHTEKSEKNNVIMSAQLRKTKLDPRTAKFISFLCNISMMKQQMVEIGYNAQKLPLGKISKSTIVKGYNILKQIADAIGHVDRKELERLSGEFYSVIPHNFGFKKMCNVKMNRIRFDLFRLPSHFFT